MSQENLRYVSESTIKNKLSELSYTLKVFGIENIGKNPQAQLKFLQIVESFTKDQFVSIDGMVVSRQEYCPKKGYALKGQRLKMRQFRIRDSVSVPPTARPMPRSGYPRPDRRVC